MKLDRRKLHREYVKHTAETLCSDFVSLHLRPTLAVTGEVPEYIDAPMPKRYSRVVLDAFHDRLFTYLADDEFQVTQVEARGWWGPPKLRVYFKSKEG